MNDENGTKPLVFVKDTGATLPHDAAERVLQWFYEHKPALLSSAIGEAYTGTPPASRRQQ